MNVYILTSEPFPYGGAASNRIKNYCQGFIELGHKVKVLCFRPKIFSANIPKVNGEHRNIKYQYLPGKVKKSKNFITRRLDIFLSYFNLVKLFLSKKNENSFIIYYSSYILPSILLYFLKKINNLRIYKEESEFRIRFNFKTKSLKYHLFKLSYFLFDGLLLMTRPLIKYFRNELNYKNPILHVPMTVDFSRFKNINKNSTNFITYCGTLNNKKDGVNILIEAFYLLQRDFSDIRLRLVGNPKNQQIKKEYDKLIQKYNIKDKVVFEGYVVPSKMPKILMEAKVLALPRPYSIQAEGGFPTKLGEYLATGNPVVVTDVGEISYYLKDRINAYIAKPGSIDDLYEKLKEVLKNYTKAKIVGNQGKNTATKYFNYKIQSEKVINFVT